MEFSIGLGVSARHLHLCKKDMAKLFGADAILHIKKGITQPGQFAAEEQVTLLTEKGLMMKLRVIGPLRKETQIELSLTDARAVGLTPPIRISGDIEGTPGGVLIGPAGQVSIEHASDAPNAIGKSFLPIFDKYGVDLVFLAHIHSYSRTVPVKNFIPASRGTVYITTGRSGDKVWEGSPQKTFDEVFYNPLDQPNYLTLEVADNELYVRAVKQDGSIIDEVHIKK